MICTLRTNKDYCSNLVPPLPLAVKTNPLLIVPTFPIVLVSFSYEKTGSSSLPVAAKEAL